MNNYHQPPLAYINGITLNIHDSKKMVDFYTSIGMKVLSQTKNETLLGITTPMLTLKHDKDYVLETNATQGLYHVAYLVPTREELGSVLKHALTNGSVVLILGSLIIGYIANEKQAEGIKPFTNELFKGFLAIFLLDMGISSGKKLKSFFSYGWFPIAFAMIFPLVNGSIVATLSPLFTPTLGDQFIFSVLAASASYIAVPAAMKVSAPQANPGLFLPMALAITFPINITLGFPIYYFLLTS